MELYTGYFVTVEGSDQLSSFPQSLVPPQEEPQTISEHGVIEDSPNSIFYIYGI